MPSRKGKKWRISICERVFAMMETVDTSVVLALFFTPYVQVSSQRIPESMYHNPQCLLSRVDVSSEVVVGFSGQT